MSGRDTERFRILARELCDLALVDACVRAELASDGSLCQGYHPRMEAIHRRNAACLGSIVDEVGWPSGTVVGAAAAESAWLIAQHAIGEPSFQRRCLALLLEAAARGDVPAWQPAMLEDRITMFEGRPQLYGTQLEADDEGWLRPYMIENPSGVGERRKQVGLPPLPQAPTRVERAMSAEERVAHDHEYEAWLKRAGWRR